MKQVAIIGAGIMGRGIIQWAAEAGATVLAFDTRAGEAAKALAFVRDLLGRAVTKGRLSEAAREDTLRRIRVVETMAELAPADLVIEAVIEDLEVKRRLFVELEHVISDEAILCTNTSSLSVTACARDCRLPGRIAGLHFFNPVP